MSTIETWQTAAFYVCWKLTKAFIVTDWDSSWKTLTYIWISKCKILNNVMPSYIKILTKYVVSCKRTYFASNSVVLLRTLATRGAIIIMDAYTSVFAGMICIYRATIFVYWFRNWCITFSWCFNVLIPLFVWKANRNILCIIKFQVIKNNISRTSKHFLYCRYYLCCTQVSKGDLCSTLPLIFLCYTPNKMLSMPGNMLVWYLSWRLMIY